ncbi:MAG: DNA topoisomerase III [Planctomycetes bacterium]|nr:DNA topoisomerase III [Planctomycetota bacterium]
MKSLVFAEKPSVAKEIARVLQCTKHNKSYFEGNQYIVTWALGHLVTLSEPEDYDRKYKEWKIEDLPMLPEKMRLKVIGKNRHQYYAVTQLMKRKDVHEMIIATDAGREGELVARWVMKLAKWNKPYKRLWISSQTDKAIQEGFANLRPGSQYDNLYYAAACRAEADWLIGLNVTRALTCKHNAQLTAGRVQTPTLAMIVDREEKIKQFKPTDYWNIVANFGDYFGHWKDKNNNTRIFQIEKANEILQKIQGKTGTIQDMQRTTHSEPPPLAYDLTELQRDANKRYNFSAKKTLSILQKLYEQYKIVTYPRTDSRYLTMDIVPTFSKRLEGMAVGPYAIYANELLTKQYQPTKRLIDNNKVTDHHAIIPTEEYVRLEKLDSDERKLYDLIARRFLAVLSPHYRYEKFTIQTTVENENFYSTGKIALDLGWKKISNINVSDTNQDNELPEQTLPQQIKGTKKTTKARLEKKKTPPPPHYTEASLLSDMESAGKFIEDEELRESIKQGGLGTPSTRAEIIEKLISYHYMERHGKNLIPTSKGIQLIYLVPEELRSPELTAVWEQRLTNIAQGKEKDQKFLQDIRKNTITLIQTVKDTEIEYKATNLTKTKCPMCKEPMLLVKGKKGNDLLCSDRKCNYRMPEKQQETTTLQRVSARESRMNKILIDKYTDKTKATTNVGDLLLAALKKKK